MFRSLSAFLLLFVIAEMALLITMGRYFGLVPTIVLVLGGGMVGAWVARWQGARTAMRARSRLVSGVMPTAEMTDGFLILVAAVLFILPGVLSDFLGFGLLFPPTRALLRRAAVSQFNRRSPLGWFVHGRAEGQAPPAIQGDQIIEARVIETRTIDE